MSCNPSHSQVPPPATLCQGAGGQAGPSRRKEERPLRSMPERGEISSLVVVPVWSAQWGHTCWKHTQDSQGHSQLWTRTEGGPQGSDPSPAASASGAGLPAAPWGFNSLSGRDKNHVWPVRCAD